MAPRTRFDHCPHACLGRCGAGARHAELARQATELGDRQQRKRIGQRGQRVPCARHAAPSQAEPTRRQCPVPLCALARARHARTVHADAGGTQRAGGRREVWNVGVREVAYAEPGPLAEVQPCTQPPLRRCVRPSLRARPVMAISAGHGLASSARRRASARTRQGAQHADALKLVGAKERAIACVHAHEHVQ